MRRLIAGFLAVLTLAQDVHAQQITGPTVTATTQTAGNASTRIANTQFVSTAITNAIAAVNPAVAAAAATTTFLPNSPTYLNGVSGVGATITAGSTNVTLVIDGYTPVLNNRLLIKNESGGLGSAKNGVYTVTQLAALGLPWILTRALDFDQPSDINSTGAIPVVNGTANAQTQWVVTSSVATVGTDAITFTQFSLNPTTIFNTAGSGLTGSGTNTVSMTANTRTRSFGTTFGDTTGSALTSGPIVYFTIPYACAISAWNITVDAGTVTFDIWKIATGAAVPTVTNTITASALPALSTGTALHSTTLTSWTTAVSANDIVGIQLKTVATAKYAELDVECDQ